MGEITSKKNKNGLLIGIMVVGLVLIGIGGFLYYQSLNSVNTFKYMVNEVFSKIEKTMDVTTVDGTYKLKVDASVVDEKYKSIVDIVNKIDISGIYQLDTINNIMNITLNSNYDGEKLINSRMYYNDSTAYVYLDEVYDKYIALSSGENTSSTDNKNEVKDIKQIVSSIKEALVSSLKDEYFTTTKEDDLHKVTLNMTKDNIIALGTDFIDALKNDQDFLKSMTSLTDKTVDEIIKDLDMELDGIKKDTYVETNYISLYTKEKSKEFVKMISEIDTGKMVITYNSNVYNVEVSENNDILYNAVLSINSNNYKVTYEDKKSGNKIVISFDFTYNQSGSIDTVDVSNNVLYSALTEEDINKILETLAENKGFQKLTNIITNMSM